jgi:hypothetical protein
MRSNHALNAHANMRTDTLSDKEADAVAAAIEDELIALRVTLFESQG